jgi:hypothetical protein
MPWTIKALLLWQESERYTIYHILQRLTPDFALVYVNSSTGFKLALNLLGLRYTDKILLYGSATFGRSLEAPRIAPTCITPTITPSTSEEDTGETQLLILQLFRSSSTN